MYAFIHYSGSTFVAGVCRLVGREKYVSDSPHLAVRRRG
jgi:hypothetical protein